LAVLKPDSPQEMWQEAQLETRAIIKFLPPAAKQLGEIYPRTSPREFGALKS
jgi:hypothetical protein